MEIRTSNVVSFRLLTGADIIGKLSQEPTNSAFAKNEDVIWLEDALLASVQPPQTPDGEAKLFLVPITGLGDGTAEGAMPFALYRGNIIGQFPLLPEVEKAYTQKTTGIILHR